MGDRAYLQSYIPEHLLNPKEKNYYQAYWETYDGSTEKHAELKAMAHDVFPKWANDDIAPLTNQIPTGEQFCIDGKVYYCPDAVFSSAENRISHTKKNRIPAYWLELFHENEFVGTWERRGKVCRARRLVTTVKQALERISGENPLVPLLTPMEEDILLELDFGELPNEALPTTLQKLAA